MEVRRDRRARRHRFDHRVVHESRMRGQEPKPPDPGHTGGETKELSQAEALVRVAVGVYGLTEERHFRIAPRRERRQLLEDFRGRAAPFPSAGEGNDAERTELVAALDDRDVSLESRAASDLAELIDGRLFLSLIHI